MCLRAANIWKVGILLERRSYLERWDMSERRGHIYIRLCLRRQVIYERVCHFWKDESLKKDWSCLEE